MDSQTADEGIYRLPAMKFFRNVSRELPDAVPPLSSAAQVSPWGGIDASQETSGYHGAFDLSAAPDLSGAFASVPISGKERYPVDLAKLIAALAAPDASAASPSQHKTVSEMLSPSQSPRRYGWVAGPVPSPDPEGRYIVEFVEKRAVKLLAYLDRFGRVFTTDTPLDSHPTREPDLRFARYEKQESPSALSGCVEVKDSQGAWREVSRFRRVKDHYSLFDSWFNFGEHAHDLAYPDALARAYLAFVYRPSLGAPDVPARGLDGVEAPLDAMPALPALRAVQSAIVQAQWDPALRPPVLAQALARWLGEAGLDQLMLAPSGALRLVRTIRYADIFYLAPTEEGMGLSSRVIWKLQNALNRYLLIKRSFSEEASVGRVEDVVRWDGRLIDAVAAKEAERLLSQADDDQGEWDTRCAIARAVENLAMPLRFDLEFRADVQAGVVSFLAVLPDSDMMPSKRWDESAQAVAEISSSERAAEALRYAQHVAVFLAAAAFSASSAVRHVEFSGYTLQEGGPFSLGDMLAAAGERESASDGALSGFMQLLPQAHLSVTFARESFVADAAAAAKGRPEPYFRTWGAVCAQDAFLYRNAADAHDAYAAGQASNQDLQKDPFRLVAQAQSASLRRDLPECADAELPLESQAALGARWARDLRIDAEALHRRQAERLAARLGPASSATEAIQTVRRYQHRADDPFVEKACTRLMAALAEGKADPDDQNTVISNYLGQDKCQDALLQARSFAQTGRVEEAGRLLSNAAWEAEASGHYADDPEVVHRAFETYPSRVLYNLMRARKVSPVEPDHDKRVELVPATLLQCHMEASRLLERSFAGMDDALAHAKRAVELAPTVTAAHCLLARIYMLMGDMTSASKSLEMGLSLATQPHEIAVAYYQLAYTRWKAGDARLGAASYVKSIAASPVMAGQAATELQGLLTEESVKLPGREEVDALLKEASVPVAPVGEVLDVLFEAAKRAVDAGVFSVGRSLLVTCLNYRPDDALMGVYRSLVDLMD